MERLNSGDERIIFGTILSTLNIGLMKCGRVKNDRMRRKQENISILC